MNKLILFDLNKDLCKAWEKEFQSYYNIRIENCSFEQLKSDYVVTAGNSYGWMTGGIDLAVRNYYGQWIQDYIQSCILNKYGRYLPVGHNILINTDDLLKPHLIYAPTMPVPMYIDKIDVFYVFAKLLQEYESFACCGLGTLTGGISEEDCAKQMRLAYEYVNRKEL